MKLKNLGLQKQYLSQMIATAKINDIQFVGIFHQINAHTLMDMSTQYQ
jgi:hypothetical protein